MGIRSALRRRLSWTKLYLTGKINWGYCTVCSKGVFFIKVGPWLRDQYLCSECHSIPRNRALIKVLEDQFPAWRELQIHESSPSGPASDKIQRECRGLVRSQYFADVPRGEFLDGYRSEDLQALTFPDESFDLVISQDVFEHVLRPELAFAEIARTLKQNGAHVFTVPYFRGKKTVVRAKAGKTGAIEHLMEPDYHGNPIDPNGSLVVTEWGDEICDFILEASGMTTTIFSFDDASLGLEAWSLDVFVSRKVQRT